MKEVMIVEDHEGMRVLYRATFGKSKEMRIMHLAESAEHALGLLDGTMPDLIIVDLSLPGMDGVEFTKRVKKQSPETKILIVSGYDPERYREPALNAGADQLISKNDIFEIIKEAKKLLGSD